MTLIFIWVVMAILGAAMLSRYNKAGIGFLLGLILGPLGLIFALVMRSGASKDEAKKMHDEQLAALKNK